MGRRRGASSLAFLVSFLVSVPFHGKLEPLSSEFSMGAETASGLVVGHAQLTTNQNIINSQANKNIWNLTCLTKMELKIFLDVGCFGFRACVCLSVKCEYVCIYEDLQE